MSSLHQPHFLRSFPQIFSQTDRRTRDIRDPKANVCLSSFSSLFISSMFLSDGSQDQGSQGKCTSIFSHLSLSISSMFLSDGKQDQGSQAKCTSIFFPSFFLSISSMVVSQTERRTRDLRQDVRFIFFIFLFFYLTCYPNTNSSWWRLHEQSQRDVARVQRRWWQQSKIRRWVY